MRGRRRERQRAARGIRHKSIGGMALSAEAQNTPPRWDASETLLIWGETLPPVAPLLAFQMKDLDKGACCTSSWGGLCLSWVCLAGAWKGTGAGGVGAGARADDPTLVQAASSASLREEMARRAAGSQAPWAAQKPLCARPAGRTAQICWEETAGRCGWRRGGGGISSGCLCLRAQSTVSMQQPIVLSH